MITNCLDEHAALDYLAGGSDRNVAAVHLDGCAPCRHMLRALALLEGSSETLPAGDTVAPPPDLDRQHVGRFEIVELLGAGAMGIVYRAEDPDLRRPVAIKVMRDAEGDHTRMLREAQAMAQLDHPNVVGVYEVGTDASGHVFIAMEYVDGRTLRGWLETPRSWRTIVEAFVQAARGLAAAHAVGVIHRDFKPDNVMVDRSDRVKVGDFGLARADSDDDCGEHLGGSPLAASITQTGAVLGTPMYMSPEQLEGRSADARADQFALCVALYAALYDQHPFEGSNLAELYESALRGPRKPKAGPANVLWPVIRRGLSPRTTDRFPDLDALLVAIDRALGARRRRLTAGIAGVLAAGIATTAIAIATRPDAPIDPTAHVWSPARADALRAAMQRSKRPSTFVADQASRAIAGIDGWIASWHATAAELDSADADPALATFRGVCLDRRLGELDTMLEVVTAAKDAQLDRVAYLFGVVRDPKLCAVVQPPRSAAPPPNQTDRFDELTKRLDSVAVLSIARSHTDMIAAIDRIEPELRTLDHVPSIARAVYLRGSALDNLGKVDLAHPILEEARTLAAKAGDPLLELRAITDLIYNANGRKDFAAARQAIAAGDALLPRLRADATVLSYDADIAEFSYLDAQAKVKHTEGDYPARIPLRVRALEIVKRTRGERSVHYASALSEYGRVLWSNDDAKQGRARFEESIAIMRETLGPDHPEVAGVMTTLGDLHQSRGEFEPARANLEGALTILTAAYGPDAPQRLKVLESLLNLDSMTHKGEEVIRRANEILKLGRAAYGEGAPQLSNPLLLRANAYLGRGDTKAARASLDEATAINDKHHGKDHPNHATNRLMRAVLEMNDGNYAASRALFERTPANSGRADPHNDVMIGEIDLLEGKAADAVRRFRAAGRAMRAEYGEAYPMVCAADAGEGRALLAAGKLREARPVLERAEAAAKRLEMGGGLAGKLRFALAKTVLALDKNRTRAVDLARSARKDLMLALHEAGVRDTAVEVAAWLEKHDRNKM